MILSLPHKLRIEEIKAEDETCSEMEIIKHFQFHELEPVQLDYFCTITDAFS